MTTTLIAFVLPMALIATTAAVTTPTPTPLAATTTPLAAITTTAAPTGTTMAATPAATGTTTMKSCYDLYLDLNSYLLNSSRYNNILPPFPPSSSSASYISVNITFILIRFNSLTNSQVLNVAGAIDMQWTDQQLSWSSNSYPCIQMMPFYASTVWNPYVYLHGSATSTIKYSLSDSDLVVREVQGTSSGRIYGDFSSGCTMNFLLFPFDTQTCYLKFLNYDLSYLKWVLSTNTVYTIGSDSSTSTGEWIIESMEVNTSTASVYARGSFTSTSMFYVTFELKRKTLYYTINVMAPTVVMWVMIALTFVLPTDRGMKVPLTVTLMLAVYTQQKNVASLLPSTTPVPYIVSILLFGLYLGALSLITAVLTVVFRVLAPKLPPSVQRCLINVVGRLCCTPKMAVEPESQKEIPMDDLMIMKPVAYGKDGDATERWETLALLNKMTFIGNQVGELVRIKKDEIKKLKISSLNESVWQKVEFLFNAVLLFAYIGVMAYYFISFSVDAGSNLL